MNFYVSKHYLPDYAYILIYLRGVLVGYIYNILNIINNSMYHKGIRYLSAIQDLRSLEPDLALLGVEV